MLKFMKTWCIFQRLDTSKWKNIFEIKKAFDLSFNTPYMSYSSIVYPVKMEYGSKNNIFGLKMMVKSGLEKIFLKFLHAQSLFQIY